MEFVINVSVFKILICMFLCKVCRLAIHIVKWLINTEEHIIPFNISELLGMFILKEMGLGKNLVLPIGITLKNYIFSAHIN